MMDNQQKPSNKNKLSLHKLVALTVLLFSLVGLIIGVGRATAVTAQLRGAITFEEQVLEIVNDERWQNGQLPPLKGEASLNSATKMHSNNMALRNFFGHCDVDTGKSPWDRMNDAGYDNWSYAGENIAAGYGSPESVMNGWINSAPHRANILSSDFREIGIGFANEAGDENNVREDDNNDCSPDSANNGPYYNYWTQNFGKRNDVLPVIINREAYSATERPVDLYMYGSGWAESMRFRNENEAWAAWQTYAPDVEWTLSCGLGEKTVYAEISDGANGSGTVRAANDMIVFNGDSGIAFSAVPSSLSFVAYTTNSPTTISNSVTIMNDGNTSVNWDLNEIPAVSWLEATPVNGNLNPCAATAVAVTISLNGLTPGIYQTDLSVNGSRGDHQSQIVRVSLLYSDQSPVFLPLILRP